MTADSDARMAARLRAVLGLHPDYPADMLPWPQVVSDSPPHAAERRSAGYAAWKAAEDEADRLRADNATMRDLLAKALPWIDPNDTHDDYLLTVAIRDALGEGS